LLSLRVGCFGVAPNELSFSLATEDERVSTKSATATTRSPGRRGDRSTELGCDVVEVVLSFALTLGNVTRF